MPRGDGTGPMGMGAMTGRAAGYCAGFDTPGFAKPVTGRGFGRGGGRGFGGRGGGGGRGWRNMFYATGLPGWMRFGANIGPDQASDPKLEKQALARQAAAMQSQLDLIKKRLGEMDAAPAGE